MITKKQFQLIKPAKDHIIASLAFELEMGGPLVLEFKYNPKQRNKLKIKLIQLFTPGAPTSKAVLNTNKPKKKFIWFDVGYVGHRKAKYFVIVVDDDITLVYKQERETLINDFQFKMIKRYLKNLKEDYGSIHNNLS